MIYKLEQKNYFFQLIYIEKIVKIVKRDIKYLDQNFDHEKFFNNHKNMCISTARTIRPNLNPFTPIVCT